MALNLDPITVNTDIAENYLKKYNYFDVFPESGKIWCFKKYPDDKIEHNAGYMPHPPVFERVKTNTIGPYMARKFVENIKQHESTFYQLEYLIRKTDKTDFQNYFLLMCQYLQCDDDAWNLGPVKNLKIIMNENTPLYALGCVAAANSTGIAPSIITTRKMAPICHLFTNLSSQIGCTIELVFVNEIKDYNFLESQCCLVPAGEKVCFGCTGVVTESADIDSALDVFIDSSVTAPWKLQQIYVQENVYDEVKEALAARCERRVIPFCDQAFAAKGKVFACEALGTECGAAFVPVEAYRTTKELCTLLRQQSTALALSLWAADSQVAHEVALAAPATLVWVNECTTFHGPPASSIPAYEPLYSGCKNMFNENDLQNLRTRWTNWNKFTKKERVDRVLNALPDLSTDPKGNEFVPDFCNNVLKARDESFVSVEDGKICIGVERPPSFEDIVYFERDNPIKSLIAAINGNVIIYNANESHESMKLLNSLVEVGAPVMEQVIEKPSDAFVEKNIFYRKLKVIRSNFGTIFAN